MSGDITPYLALVPSANQAQPNFMATIAATLQPMADGIALYKTMQTLFDVDTAVGDALDAIGAWVGITRNIAVPITNVYFSLDIAGLGLDQGVLMGPYDPSSGLVQLPDAQYRTLIRAKIAANHWDGTNAGAEQVLAPVFPNGTLFIQDNGDMTMFIGYVGQTLDPLTHAIFTGGYLSVKPASVYIRGYATTSVPNAPIFGLDANNRTIGGLDYGALATIVGGG
jgi:hypothetical protein